MEISLFIAKIIGLLYVSFGIGLLFNRSFYQKEIISLFENTGYFILGGMIAIVGGLAIVTYHNIWSGGWPVVITVIGWISLVKGVLFLAFPKLLKVIKPVYEDKNTYNILTPFVLIFGVFFTYLGFFSS